MIILDEVNGILAGTFWQQRIFSMRSGFWPMTFGTHWFVPERTWHGRHC